ncbi:swi5-like zinc finger protein [Phlyctochytrium planicorne]|nr:swi5-like zinc finger protein [Phlyctochytrium planicorne]
MQSDRDDIVVAPNELNQTEQPTVSTPPSKASITPRRTGSAVKRAKSSGYVAKPFKSPLIARSAKADMLKSPLAKTLKKSSLGSPSVKASSLPGKQDNIDRDGLEMKLEQLSSLELKLRRELSLLIHGDANVVIPDDAVEVLLSEQIELLHAYNETKDFCQLVLGKIAEMRGVTIKSLYPHYDISLSD